MLSFPLNFPQVLSTTPKLWPCMKIKISETVFSINNDENPFVKDTQFGRPIGIVE